MKKVDRNGVLLIFKAILFLFLSAFVSIIFFRRQTKPKSIKHPSKATHRSSSFEIRCFNFACDDAYSPRRRAKRKLRFSTVHSNFATPNSSESCCCVAPKELSKQRCLF